jgi:hypothetical protein
MTRGLALLICPFLSGCLGYGYPSFCQTPGAAIDDPGVRAFRVTNECKRRGCIIAGSVMFAHQVEPIGIVDSRVEAQTNNSFVSYYLLFPFEGHSSRTVKVLLYRPGYETVEIPERPWWTFLGKNQPERVVWKEACDLSSQVKALEMVVPWKFGGSGVINNKSCGSLPPNTGGWPAVPWPPAL